MDSPLKWHGGKHYFAKKFIALMPPRCKSPNAPAASDPGWLHYVEPYFGSGAVMLENDPNGISEVANDLNCALTNFWAAIQDDECFEQFKRRVEAIPCSEIEFDAAAKDPELQWDKKGGMLGHAVNFFVRCRQSRAGCFKDFTTLAKTRTRRSMNELPSAWLTAIDKLPEVHARLRRVVILNRDALDVMRSQDGPRTLFYLDPPYLFETRATTGQYAHEMTGQQHVELLDTLKQVKGRFMLSGYRSKLYDDAAACAGWNLHEFETPNHAAGGDEKRTMTECLWCNF